MEDRRSPKTDRETSCGRDFLVEKEAPEGYQKAEKMKFHVKAEEAVQKVTLYNKKSRRKTDTADTAGQKRDTEDRGF